jgi:hypothetical protein
VQEVTGSNPVAPTWFLHTPIVVLGGGLFSLKLSPFRAAAQRFKALPDFGGVLLRVGRNGFPSRILSQFKRLVPDVLLNFPPLQFA